MAKADDRGIMVAPGTRVSLDAFDPADTLWLRDKEQAERELRRDAARLADLQYRLWAERRRALLVVLQGVDTSGKDGAIRNVFSGLNPLGVRAHSFGRPTAVELAHDFLWRVHAVTPGRGSIAIFNRSHYEDVLVARVERLAADDAIEERYGIINEFERMLATDAGGSVTILKFFLHISREEQRERLLARLEDPTGRWKAQPGDLDVWAQWDQYQRAYEAALSRCSTPWAPWRVVPADRKWARNGIVARVVADVLEGMAPRFPPARADLQAMVKRLS